MSENIEENQTVQTIEEIGEDRDLEKEKEETLNNIEEICSDLIQDNKSLQSKLNKEEEKSPVLRTEESNSCVFADVSYEEDIKSESSSLSSSSSDEENDEFEKLSKGELVKKFRMMETVLESKNEIISDLELQLEELKENKSVVESPKLDFRPTNIKVSESPENPLKIETCKKLNNNSPMKQLVSSFMKEKRRNSMKKRQSPFADETLKKQTERKLTKVGSIKDLEIGIRDISKHKKNLEIKLSESENLSDFTQAKIHHEKLRDLNFLETRMMEKKIEIMLAAQTKGLGKKHAEELEKFEKYWKKQEKNHHFESSKCIQSLLKEQTKEFNKYHKNLINSLSSLPIKHSRKLRDMQNHIRALVQRKKYKEADVLQQQACKPLELLEIKKYYEDRESTIKKKCDLFRKKQKEELSHVKKRFEVSFAKLSRKSEGEKNSLIRNQRRKKKSIEQNCKKILSEYKFNLKKQMEVMEKNYEKNVVNFDKMSTLFSPGSPMSPIGPNKVFSRNSLLERVPNRSSKNKKYVSVQNIKEFQKRSNVRKTPIIVKKKISPSKYRKKKKKAAERKPLVHLSYNDFTNSNSKRPVFK